MRKYRESTQKNVFSELLSFLGRMTQENLTHQIEYLKVENEILRKRVGRSIRPTPIERRNARCKNYILLLAMLKNRLYFLHRTSLNKLSCSRNLPCKETILFSSAP